MLEPSGIVALCGVAGWTIALLITRYGPTPILASFAGVVSPMAAASTAALVAGLAWSFA